MILKMVRWFAEKLQCRRITGEDGSLYLERYKVFGWMPGDKRKWPVSIYLHRFARPDNDPAPHCHPWAWAISLILTGGYAEERLVNGETREVERGPLSLALLRSNTFHNVAELRGETWTLFIVGPKTKSWGFMVPGRGYVPWRDRLRERGIEPSY